MRFFSSPFSRFSNYGTSSITKPLFLFCLVALIPALVFNSLIITGCTTTAPTSRKFYLVQFKYNTTSEFYQSLILNDNKNSNTKNNNSPKLRYIKRATVQADTSSSSATKSESATTASQHSHQTSTSTSTSASASASTTTSATPSANPSTSSSPPQPLKTPDFTQIRISHRAVCLEHSNPPTWSCSTSLNTLPKPTNDPSDLISIANLYLAKIAWETPIWFTLATLILSYLLLLVNALPIPLLPNPPAWTRKTLFVLLALSTLSLLASMVLSTTTSSAVASLVTTITQNAIEVHIGRADLIFGWFLWALLALSLGCVGVVVGLEFTVEKARHKIEVVGNGVLEKAIGGGNGGSLSGGSLRSSPEVGGRRVPPYPVSETSGSESAQQSQQDRDKGRREQALKLARGMVEAKTGYAIGGGGGRANGAGVGNIGGKANALGLIIPGRP